MWLSTPYIGLTEITGRFRSRPTRFLKRVDLFQKGLPGFKQVDRFRSGSVVGNQVVTYIYLDGLTTVWPIKAMNV